MVRWYLFRCMTQGVFFGGVKFNSGTVSSTWCPNWSQHSRQSGDIFGDAFLKCVIPLLETSPSHYSQRFYLLVYYYRGVDALVVVGEEEGRSEDPLEKVRREKG